ncbi:hypothetical protein N1851_024414 [Merluccius polli]|uniref:Uncharacterized protein n=1 Tax=Merluccius polli TaxID=89951 RepID=A0AA47MFA1_MERPO|nr:hypothetical protein N1851_024414 [Merluccius polli]
MTLSCIFTRHCRFRDDTTFTLSFNLIVIQKGQEKTYTMTKTCSPTLPWSAREINCKVNYMELTNDMPFPTGTRDIELTIWLKTIDMTLLKGRLSFVRLTNSLTPPKPW